MAYPVSIDVVPLTSGRNRLTTAFRLILAIPHLILVGGAGLGVGTASRGDNTTTAGSETGLLGAVAAFLAVASWFTIVFTGRHIAGIRQFTAFYLRWRVRALSYVALLQDAYPPLGDAPYPAALDIVDPPEPRERLTVAFRLILGIPHFVALFFVLIAWVVTSVIAWFAIVITGTGPLGLLTFGVGALRWRLRLEAYLLLMVDEYPPFSLH